MLQNFQLLVDLYQKQKNYAPLVSMTVDLEVAVIDSVMTEILDLSQYLTNCSPTPPLTQHQP